MKSRHFQHKADTLAGGKLPSVCELKGLRAQYGEWFRCNMPPKQQSEEDAKTARAQKRQAQADVSAALARLGIGG